MHTDEFPGGKVIAKGSSTASLSANTEAGGSACQLSMSSIKSSISIIPNMGLSMFTKNVEKNGYLHQNRWVRWIRWVRCRIRESVPGFLAESMEKQTRRHCAATTTDVSPFADDQPEYAAGHGGQFAVLDGHEKLRVRLGLCLQILMH